MVKIGFIGKYRGHLKKVLQYAVSYLKLVCASCAKQFRIRLQKKLVKGCVGNEQNISGEFQGIRLDAQKMKFKKEK